jgi:hypothetical protein
MIVVQDRCNEVQHGIRRRVSLSLHPPCMTFSAERIIVAGRGNIKPIIG